MKRVIIITFLRTAISLFLGLIIGMSLWIPVFAETVFLLLNFLAVSILVFICFDTVSRLSKEKCPYFGRNTLLIIGAMICNGISFFLTLSNNLGTSFSFLATMFGILFIAISFLSSFLEEEY